MVFFLFRSLRLIDEPLPPPPPPTSYRQLLRHGQRSGEPHHGEQRTAGHQVRTPKIKIESKKQSKELIQFLRRRNALNIVKDDLIAKVHLATSLCLLLLLVVVDLGMFWGGVQVDELSSEQEILRDEIRSLHQMRNRLRLRTDELEAECKMLREEIDSVRKAAKSEDEVP